MDMSKKVINVLIMSYMFDGACDDTSQTIPVSSHVVNNQQQWQHTRGSITRMKASEPPRRHIKWRKNFYKNNPD